MLLAKPTVPVHFVLRRQGHFLRCAAGAFDAVGLSPAVSVAAFVFAVATEVGGIAIAVAFLLPTLFGGRSASVAIYIIGHSIGQKAEFGLSKAPFLKY